MKLHYTFLYISLLAVKANFAQTENNVTCLKSNKVVSVTLYDINVPESKLEECLHTPSWYKQNIIDSSVYDNQGKLVLHRVYENQNRKTFADTKYEFNSAGLLTKTMEFNNAKPKMTDSIVYNKENLIAYRKMYYNFINTQLYETKVEYTFAKRNLPVETRTVHPIKGTVNTLTVKTFDAKDRLVEEVVYWGSREEKNMQEKKIYTYHSDRPAVIKEIKTYKTERAELYFVQKFDNKGFMIENISYNPRRSGEIKDKTTIRKDNNKIVEIYFDYAQQESPVQKKVTTLSKNCLKEVTKFYQINAAGKEVYQRAIKYDYQFTK